MAGWIPRHAYWEVDMKIARIVFAAALSAALAFVATLGMTGNASAERMAATAPSPAALAPVFGSYQGSAWDHRYTIQLSPLGAGKVQVYYQDHYVGEDPRWKGWSDPAETHTASYGVDGSFTITTDRTGAVITFSRCGALQCASIDSKTMRARSAIVMTPT